MLALQYVTAISDVAKFTRIAPFAVSGVRLLSTGEQQMLALGRALMLKPKLLLADEPSLGLSPNFVELVFDKLVEINKLSTSILLVEQKTPPIRDCRRTVCVEDLRPSPGIVHGHFRIGVIESGSS